MTLATLADVRSLIEKAFAGALPRQDNVAARRCRTRGDRNIRRVAAGCRLVADRAVA
jgi:hypothetical protein